MGELEARVRQHVEEEAVALGQHDADAVAGQRLHAFDGAKVALEVGGGAHLAVGLVAVEGQVEPQLHVRRREGRAVVPQRVVPQREGPLRLGGVHGPRRGQVGASQVQVLPAAHDQVARAEQCSAHVVQGNAARAHGVEAGGRVAAVGEDHHPAVGPVGRRGRHRGRREGDGRRRPVRRWGDRRLCRCGSVARRVPLIIAGAAQREERKAPSEQGNCTESHGLIVLVGSRVHKGGEAASPHRLSPLL